MSDIKKAAENLEKLGYTVKLCATKAEAADYLDAAIDATSVGFGGSVTAQELDLYDRLGAHNEVHWHWKGGEEERPLAQNSKIYITSANGLAQTGEIINIDGGGNRVASTLYGHEKVYFVIGRNKLAPTYDEALWCARNIAGPRNAQRLGRKTPCAVKGDRCYDCKSPERICRGLVVMWGPMLSLKTEIVLVDEDLGM